MVNKNKELNFDIDKMKHFYCQKYENNLEVRETWYIYVLKFLPLVSGKWKKLVSNNNLQNTNSMFNAITTSDEALVRWFIVLWMKSFDDIKEKKILESDKSKGKGPHDIKSNIKLYTILHCEIEEARKDFGAAVRWNKIFWDEVKTRNSALFEMRKEQCKYSTIETNSNELQLPGLDEDHKFLATYCLDDEDDTQREEVQV
jgi:hypothetical protein